jgi:hypothetical protein
MFRRRNSWPLKGFAALFLGLQLHLLWVAVVHSHEPQEGVPGTQAAFHTTRDAGSPLANGSHYCVVCQIVRQSAVRPAVAHPAPMAAGVVRVRPGFSSATLDSRQPSPIYGRAPPLA